MIQILDYLTGRNRELKDLEYQVRELELEEVWETRHRAEQDFSIKVQFCFLN